MPSPFGKRRSASTYYQHAGSPTHYALDWTGLPPGPTRAAETMELGRYVPSAGDTLDIVAQATYHKDLSDYDVAMTLDSGRQSVVSSGPEQALGFFGQMSSNEKRLVTFGAIGLAGWLAWKHFGKKRRGK